MSNDLLKQIDELVASKTFNLDALDGIKQIKDSHKDTLNSLAREQDNVLRLTRDLTMEKSKCDKHEAEISTLKATIDLLRGGELKAKEAVWEKLIAEASANAYKDALYTVFKPSAVRESIQRQVARPVEGHPGGNGYSPTGGYLSTGQETEIITKEEL
jgi:hypothetical protein